MGCLGQGGRHPVDVISAIPSLSQDGTEALRQGPIAQGAALDPRLLFVHRIPCSTGNAEGWCVWNAVVREDGVGVITGVLERGDHKIVSDALDHRRRYADRLGKADDGLARERRQWTRSV